MCRSVSGHNPERTSAIRSPVPEHSPIRQKPQPTVAHRATVPWAAEPRPIAAPAGLGKPIDAPDGLAKYRLVHTWRAAHHFGRWRHLDARQHLARGSARWATFRSGFLAGRTGQFVRRFVEPHGFGLYGSRGGHAICCPAATRPPAPSQLLLAALKEELFTLEVERQQGTLSSEEYEKARAALEQTLQRALNRTQS